MTRTGDQDFILEIKQLKMHFPIYKGIFFRKKIGTLKAVDGVDFNLKKGETLGIVGESGSGKSTLARTILRLYKPSSGQIILNKEDITYLTRNQLKPFRSQCQMVFQDPYASLNPRLTIYDTLREPITLYKPNITRQELHSSIIKLMDAVGLPKAFLKKYPHEFSGGQRQRIAIARALSIQPQIIICDEPISALDVSIQAQILNLLKDLQKEFALSYIFISHDLQAVKYLCDRIAVMYLGKIAELANKKSLFTDPSHPYSKALLSAAPLADPDRERARQRILLSSDIPSPLNPPSGCSFHTRCQIATTVCKKETPVLEQGKNGHLIACLKAFG